MTEELRDAFRAAGRITHYPRGEFLRRAGKIESDLLYILSGTVECVLPDERVVTLSKDDIVGEIGFLTGEPATATLRAVEDVTAVSLTAPELAKLKQDAPEAASEILRRLAREMSERSRFNASHTEKTQPASFVVRRCSTFDLQRQAQRLRYEILCLERGLDDADADHEEGLIVDDKDDDGESFVLNAGPLAIGTGRVRLSGAGCAILDRILVQSGEVGGQGHEILLRTMIEFATTIGPSVQWKGSDEDTRILLVSLGYTVAENGMLTPS